MVFIETSFFTRALPVLLSDDEYRELQAHLLDTPDAGAVISGGGGIRKMRWGMHGKGKRGGVRVIYYWRVSVNQILMLYLYPKNVQDDLTSEQLAALRKAAEGFNHE
jgi:mRNA-degrading endonuclease RelE of RelBE toxin-antitoxin system